MRIELGATGTIASVDTRGAELQSLRGPDGHERIWQAHPAWPRHAPLLFPTICRARDDRVTRNGESYPMPKHGFARDVEWEVVTQTTSSVELRLVASERTRVHYPYAFEIRTTYAIKGARMEVELVVTNLDTAPLPFAFGAHPAFAIPEQADQAEVVFERPETGLVRRVVDDLLVPSNGERLADPRRLDLASPALEPGAVVLEQVASRQVQLRHGLGRDVRFGLEIAFSGFDHLTVWSPPGIGLVCVEPWFGLPGSAPSASEAGGATLLAPAARRHFSWSIACV